MAQRYPFSLIFTTPLIVVRRREAVQGTTYRTFLERPELRPLGRERLITVRICSDLTAVCHGMAGRLILRSSGSPRFCLVSPT